MKCLESHNWISYVDVFPSETGSRGEAPIALEMNHTPGKKSKKRKPDRRVAS